MHNANTNRVPCGVPYSHYSNVSAVVGGGEALPELVQYNHVALCILLFAGVRCVDFHTLYDQPFRSERWACFHSPCPSIL